MVMAADHETAGERRVGNESDAQFAQQRLQFRLRVMLHKEYSVCLLKTPYALSRLMLPPLADRVLAMLSFEKLMKRPSGRLDRFRRSKTLLARTSWKVNLALQGMDANQAWRAIRDLTGQLDIPVAVEFEWRDKEDVATENRAGRLGCHLSAKRLARSAYRARCRGDGHRRYDYERVHAGARWRGSPSRRSHRIGIVQSCSDPGKGRRRQLIEKIGSPHWTISATG